MFLELGLLVVLQFPAGRLRQVERRDYCVLEREDFLPFRKHCVFQEDHRVLGVGGRLVLGFDVLEFGNEVSDLFLERSLLVSEG